MIHLLPFGSRVYGLTNPKSDYDFVAIACGDYVPEYIDTGYGSSEVEIWTVAQFKERLEAYDLKALEIYYENNEFCRYKLNVLFPSIDKEKLRRAVSAVVSNAHVKAKKKIADGEIYAGLKSYFHCIRILTMFNALAKHGTFKPSGFVNELDYAYQDILRRQKDNPITMFTLLEADYKKLLKTLQHQFKLQCPLPDKSA